MKKTAIKKSNIFRGGAKQKDPTISSFEAVYRMICVPGATLTKISYASLKGFIFRLDVPQNPANSEFFTLNANKTALSSPVYSLIFKFAILSDKVGDELDEQLMITGDRKSYEKDLEELDGFILEAKNQQDIYVNTLSPSGNPVTISVVDFSYFNNLKSVFLLSKLKVISSDPKCADMLKYLEKNVVNGRKLGMITMELANSEFKELSYIDKSSPAYSLDCDYALAQIFTLFTKLKKMNYDCHVGNVLASPDPNPGLDRALLIDFGRVVTITRDDKLDGLSGPEFNYAIRLYDKVSPNDYETDRDRVLKYNIADLFLVESGRSTNENEVVAKMEDILKFIARLDYAINCTLFNFQSVNWDKPQISGLLIYLYGERFGSIWGRSTGNRNWEHGTNEPNWVPEIDTKTKYRKIAQIIRAIAQDPIESRNLVSKQAIQRSIQTGEIVTIDHDDPTMYDRSNFDFMNSNRQNVSNKDEMDGKPRFGGRRRKTRKGIRKTRKTRRKTIRRK